jgi:hypothetical protein
MMRGSISRSDEPTKADVRRPGQPWIVTLLCTLGESWLYQPTTLVSACAISRRTDVRARAGLDEGRLEGALQAFQVAGEVVGHGRAATRVA